MLHLAPARLARSTSWLACRLRDAKECLEKAVRLRNLKAAERKRFRGYQESDSPGIAKLVCERGWLTRPEGRSDSYAYFQREIAAIDF